MDDLPPLTVALVTIEYPPDPFSAGIGSYTKALADGLAARNHRVHVVARGSEHDVTVEEDGVTVHRLTPGRPDLPAEIGYAQMVALAVSGLRDELRYRRKIVSRLERLVREEGVELIEAADHLGEPGGYRPDHHARIPFVVRLHTPLAHSETIDRNLPELLRRLVGRFERRLLGKATHLTAPNRFSAEAFRDSMRLGERPITVYPNPPTFNLQPPPDRGREEPCTLLFVGRISRWKGAHLLVQALPLVAESFPEVRLELVGADNFAYGGFPTVADYLRQLLPARHRERLTFTGHVAHDRVADFYRRATVCVFPSLFESFGYTCLEAMTYGKAIVGSRHGGMLEMLDEGRAGRLYTPPDLAELASAICELLGSPDLRAELGDRARARFATRYHPERVLDQAIAFYRKAVADRGG